MGNFCGYAWPHFRGKQKALHTKKNVETVEVKTILQKSAAEKRPKCIIKAVWWLLDDKDQPSYSESEESGVESVYTLNTSKKDRITTGVNDKSVNFIIDTGSDSHNYVNTAVYWIWKEMLCTVISK